LIGITGTNGKTTTAHLVHQILNGAGMRCGLIGTVEIDDGRETAPSTLTTPPATELSRTLGVMAENGCRAAVMEVSSHALDQARVAALEYDVGVFTNLTGDHLDYHGTMEEYAAAKARLFQMLPDGGWAIVNGEDRWAEAMVQGCRARVVSCTIDQGQGPCRSAPRSGGRQEWATASVYSLSIAGADARFKGPWEEFRVQVPLLGRHNVMNALQAAMAAMAAGVAPPMVERQLARASAPPGRLEPVTPTSHPFTVLVDYAHTDDALRKALTTLRPLVGAGAVRSSGAGRAHARLSAVFGCGGDRDATKRPRMGAAAVELADQVYITSDNPRTERPAAIIDQILAGIPGESREKVRVDADRRRAIERAIGEARPGDVVLIAGKGHETYQILSDGRGGTETIHFDDRQVVREVMGVRSGRRASEATA
jgi:UDP-N-acetylmuramyl-tripeptide synthetase